MKYTWTWLFSLIIVGILIYFVFGQLSQYNLNRRVDASLPVYRNVEQRAADKALQEQQERQMEDARQQEQQAEKDAKIERDNERMRQLYGPFGYPTSTNFS